MVTSANPAVVLLPPSTPPTPPRTQSFPFLALPRELRDQIYHHLFSLQEKRNQRALRIERRSLKYFQPTAPSILLILHHEYLLLNRQIAREALEVLFKKHTLFLSCGPFVLKTLLERIECANGPARQWLKWIRAIELDWVTFPNLAFYPPDRAQGRDARYWEQYDQVEVDVDYIRGAQQLSNGHYDEYDHEGHHYDDNMYDPSDVSLYPSFRPPTATQAHMPSADDPFGFAHHNPYHNPAPDPEREASVEETATKLDLLVSMEVTPLFAYLDSPTFNLTIITLPLYFFSKQTHRDHRRPTPHPGVYYALPPKIHYWVHVCIHALHMLTACTPRPSSLQHVRVKYLPWDIWASMDPADDLPRIAQTGACFDGPEDGVGSHRERQGAALRAVWAGLLAQRSRTTTTEDHLHDPPSRRMASIGLQAAITFVPWDGDVDSCRVGDELDIVFSPTSPRPCA